MGFRLIRAGVANAPHRTGLALAGITLLGMAALTLAGVIARYLLHRPIPGVTEFVGECLMVLVIYFAMSSAHHIRVSVVINRLPGMARLAVEYVVLFISVIVLGVAVYASYGGALVSLETGETTSGVQTIDIYPFRFVIVIGLAFTVLRVLQLRRRWLQHPGALDPGDDTSDAGDGQRPQRGDGWT